MHFPVIDHAADIKLIQGWFTANWDVSLTESEAEEFWRHYSHAYWSAGWLITDEAHIEQAANRMMDEFRSMGVHKWKL